MSISAMRGVRVASSFRLGIVQVLFGTGCDGARLVSDRMVGCYSDRRAGQSTIRISKDSSGYEVSVRETGRRWSSAMLHRPTVAERSAAFGPDTTSIVEGLISSTSAFAVFRFRSEARL